MKIIELLNKIANGEEVPEKIKFNEEVYKYHDKEHGYCKHHYDNTYICLNSEYYLFDILNDEVEIIEEDKKIEKIEVIPYGKCIHEVTHKEKEILLEIRDIEMKFNKIIDYLMENK